MKEFNYEIVKNPRIFQENRLPAHSDHEFYEDDSYEYGEKTGYKYSLNGIWKFNYAKNYAMADKTFMDVEVNCKSWNDISVPAHIQLEGYDKIQYVNTQYPWDGHEQIEPGEIPVDENPTASYVKYFTVPDNMKNGPVYISFQGVESGFALWLNGKYVGYSEDSFTPAEFDLSEYLVEGENKLSVMVFKWTAGSWCEDQDFFRFSGIFREVYLYTFPKTHVRDLRLETKLSADYGEAELEINTEVVGKGSIEIIISDDEVEVINKAALKEGFNTATIPVRAPKLWSAEKPKLYDLKLVITDEAGMITEIIKEKVGFRKFELINNVMHINGKRIVFKGVNRHEFSSAKGRCLDEEDILKDIITIKKNNMNAIRCSHYPNQTAFYRLCDIFGIYVIDETNLETHGTWMTPIINRKVRPIEFAVPGDRPEFEENVIDRAHSMFERDKNHPCILIWSLGNESFGGSNLQKMHDKFYEWDKTRLVHYEGLYNDRRYNGSSDMESTMYAPVSEIKEFLKEHKDKPYINCEYSHAMGNSCGAIEKYTELAYEEELFQGGFIWDYIDQAITTKDRYGNEFEGYGGDFGDRPHDGSFSGDGLCYSKDRLPTPKMQEVKYVYQPIKISVEKTAAIIENRLLFTNTNEFTAVLTVEHIGDEAFRQEFTIDCEPLNSVEVPFVLDIPDNDEYVVTLSFALREDTLWASKGYEIAYGQTTVGDFQINREIRGELKVVEGFENIGIKGDSFEVLFSNSSQGLVSYKYLGKELLKKSIKPNFWRPMTENDIANQLPFRAGQWKTASKYQGMNAVDEKKYSSMTLEKFEDHVSVGITYYLATRPLVCCNVKYDVYPDGIIRVDLYLPKSDMVGELPEISMLFDLDADYENLLWYGRGPLETYSDKNHAKIGLYKNKVQDNMARYLMPQECGNHEEVRFAEVTNNKGQGLLFITNGLGVSALPYSPNEIDEAAHIFELPQVHHTYVRIGKQMGVGGDNTWGAKTHPEYLLNNSKDMHISFMFKGI